MVFFFPLLIIIVALITKILYGEINRSMNTEDLLLPDITESLGKINYRSDEDIVTDTDMSKFYRGSARGYRGRGESTGGSTGKSTGGSIGKSNDAYDIIDDIMAASQADGSGAVNGTTPFAGGSHAPKSGLTKFKPKSYSQKYDTRPFNTIFATDIVGDVFREEMSRGSRPPIRTVDEIPREIPYVEGMHVYTPTVHNGQFKLFMRELNASNLIMKYHKENDKNDSNAADPIYIVYAGSSPCNKLYLLAEMFPRFKFILVDPNETLIYTDVGSHMRTSHYRHDPGDIIYFRTLHDNRYERDTVKRITALVDGRPERIIRENYREGKFPALDTAVDFILADTTHRIYIFEDFMTMEFATILAKVPRLHFWSDIRTNSGIADNPTDIDLIWNLSQQYNWITRASPLTYSLKFRVPFYDAPAEKYALWKQEPYLGDLAASKIAVGENPPIDFERNYNQKQFTYLAGVPYIQSFPGKSSTEVGLFGYTDSGRVNLTTYDIHAFENKLFYYNLVERQLHHINPLVNSTTRTIGFDNCNCCAITAAIFLEWAELHGRGKDSDEYLSKLIVRLANTTGRNFYRNGHGYLLAPPTEKYYMDLFNQWSTKYIN